MDGPASATYVRTYARVTDKLLPQFLQAFVVGVVGGGVVRFWWWWCYHITAVAHWLNLLIVVHVATRRESPITRTGMRKQVSK